MGTGIAEVLARAGREVIGIDVSEAAAAQAVAALEASTARAVRARAAHRAASGADALARFRTFTDLAGRRRRRPRHRGGSGVVRDQAAGLPGARRHRAARDDPRHRHQRPVRDPARRRLGPPRARARAALLQPGARHEAGRGGLLGADRAARPSRRSPTSRVELGKEPVAVGDRPGFVADGLLFGYLNQAAAMYEAKYASREDIDAAMRLGCGLPMGPLALLDLIGVDTARTVLEAMYAESHDRLHAPAPDPQAAQRGGADRPQVGPRLLHVRGPGQRHGRAGRADARSRATPRRAGAHGPLGRRRRAPGRWPPASPRSSPRPATTVVLAARSEEKAETAKARIGKSLARSVDKGRHDRGGGGADPGPDHPGRLATTPSPTSTWRSRRSPRTWTSSSSCSRRSTRSASRARSWPPPPPRCRSWPAPAPPRARRT